MAISRQKKKPETSSETSLQFEKIFFFSNLFDMINCHNSRYSILKILFAKHVVLNEK